MAPKINDLVQEAILQHGTNPDTLLASVADGLKKAAARYTVAMEFARDGDDGPIRDLGLSDHPDDMRGAKGLGIRSEEDRQRTTETIS